MKPRTTTVVSLIAGLALVAVVAFGGYAVIRARAASDVTDARQELAPVVVETPSESASAEPEYERWTVGKANGSVTVLKQPRRGAAVKVRLGKVNANGYPTLVLVDTTREVKGVVWYRVWLAIRPNGSRGWVREGQLALYTTSARIDIDLSERKLRVYRRGELKGTFPVAVGKPGLETPTGFFFVNQKLRPSTTGTAYGVLAIGISAFQPKLAYWEQGGPVAIHGTNEDDLIGKAVSHGCVRMHNDDVLRVSHLVPAGSPVVIHK